MDIDQLETYGHWNYAAWRWMESFAKVPFRVDNIMSDYVYGKRHIHVFSYVHAVYMHTSTIYQYMCWWYFGVKTLYGTNITTLQSYLLAN